MANPLQRFKKRLRKPSSPSQAAKLRAKRRKWALDKGARVLPYLQILLAVAGCIQYLVLPLPVPQLARRTFIDENAVQPGQVNTYFSWPDVSTADHHAEQLTALVNATSEERSQYIQAYLNQAGLSGATQSYSMRAQATHLAGVNTYAILRAAKTSGAEAIVLAAPWHSRQTGMVNTRGVSSLLALSKHLQKLSVWSKDIILVFPDGDLDGLKAWLQTYHAYESDTLSAEPLDVHAGSIWSALVVDYPYHSFSHIGIYYDGVNGRLPNLDLVNSAVHIARWVGGVPVRLHNQSYIESSSAPSLTQNVARYKQRARGLLQQTEYGMTTRPSGPEGLFGQYGIDAVGLFAVPAEGPHGFYAIGRVVESIARASNNVIERLHASFFLYMLPEPFQFLTVASYLPAPLLLGASLTVAGLRAWRRAPEQTGLYALAAVVACYLTGLVALAAGPMLSLASAAGLLSLVICIPSLLRSMRKSQTAILAISLLCGGMTISTATILNYGMGAALAIALAGPLLLVNYTSGLGRTTRQITQVVTLSILTALVVNHLAPVQTQVAVAGAPAEYVSWGCLAPLWLQALVAVI